MVFRRRGQSRLTSIKRSHSPSEPAGGKGGGEGVEKGLPPWSDPEARDSGGGGRGYLVRIDREKAARKPTPQFRLRRLDGRSNRFGAPRRMIGIGGDQRYSRVRIQRLKRACACAQRST